nr:MAG TPA: hypothetical protein [Herelleviridae sp.]
MWRILTNRTYYAKHSNRTKIENPLTLTSQKENLNTLQRLPLMKIQKHNNYGFFPM